MSSMPTYRSLHANQRKFAAILFLPFWMLIWLIELFTVLPAVIENTHGTAGVALLTVSQIGFLVIGIFLTSRILTPPRGYAPARPNAPVDFVVTSGKLSDGYAAFLLFLIASTGVGIIFLIVGTLPQGFIQIVACLAGAGFLLKVSNILGRLLTNYRLHNHLGNPIIWWDQGGISLPNVGTVPWSKIESIAIKYNQRSGLPRLSIQAHDLQDGFRLISWSGRFSVALGSADEAPERVLANLNDARCRYQA